MDSKFELPVLGNTSASDAERARALSADLTIRAANGKQYWRSLDELADSPEFDSFVRREYPSQTEVLIDPFSRRSFLKLMGASLGVAGLAACTVQPKEEVIPYVRQPEEVVPGKALYFATAMPRSGGAMGLLVRSNEGRPTKVEGNPDHPASLGATDSFAQGEILRMYDPDRSQSMMHMGDISSWGEFVNAMTGRLSMHQAKKGEGLRFLTESVTSPSMSALMQSIASDMPNAKWHQYEPARGSGSFYGVGASTSPMYRFDKADRILSLDSDFMMGAGTSVRHARDWAEKRKVSASSTGMSRMYMVETSFSTTGANADNRLAVKPSDFEGIVGALASAMSVGGGSGNAGNNQAFVNAVAKDLLSAKGRSIVIAGDWQSPYVHAMAAKMNDALGNVGQTIFYSTAAETSPMDHVASITDLALDMAKGEVESLIILGGVNPVYSAPADLQFAEATKKVPFIVHHGLYRDETAQHAHWHINEAHFLESWGDARAHDGTASIIQPLISPLYGGKTASEVLTTFTKNPSLSAYEIVKNYWTGGSKSATVETTWRQALNDGVIQNTATTAGAAPAPAANPQMNNLAAGGYEIVFRPDPTIYDGRYANLGWLQELPKPISTLTWDNAAYMSRKTAEALELNETLRFKGGEYVSDVVHIEVGDLSVNAPVWIIPGQPDNTITLHLGYGRKAAGRVGNDLGFDAGRIRTTKNYWFATGAKVTKKGDTYELAGTQVHFSMEGRDSVRAATFDEYKKDLDFVHHPIEHSMLPNDTTTYEDKIEDPTKDMSLFP
ncbi:MAG TPA: TAT-variant-translocated molybdopterin oxidoreductase, partial [Candidatus Kapabacteria bacterium]